MPTRLNGVATAKLLGFGAHEIQALTAARKLTQLGGPAPNAPKQFAAVEVIRSTGDRDWLNKATNEISKHRRQKQERQVNTLPLTRS
jgi:hypothetical protein